MPGLLTSRMQHGCTCFTCAIAAGLLVDALMQALNEDGCMLGAKIVWITLMETRSVRRWAAYNPVTDDTLHDWSGFVSMIVDSYLNRQMSWFPIERLQLELSAVQDLCAPPHDVVEWARIVYTVLEKVHPQFAKE
eukprot:GHRQ01016205.1.p2 GENE.GHRQ01016205.1~~GHRQ01016205.1.p2  ORF type:complete len:135 (+),score=22.32 GHRQ01016205.1:693-1097(+)